MKKNAQPARRFADSRTKKARIRVGVALAAGALMVLAATQVVDTSAALTDSVVVNSGQLAVDANLLPRPQFVDCQDLSGFPNTQSDITWKHLGPGYSYRIDVRWPDGSDKFTTTVAAGGTVSRGGVLTYRIASSNIRGLTGREMTLRIFPVLNGVAGDNWVGVYFHVGSAPHVYCNGATYGSGNGAHVYPANLLTPGGGTPLARNAQPPVNDEMLAPTASAAVEDQLDADVRTTSSTPPTTSARPSTTDQATSTPSTTAQESSPSTPTTIPETSTPSETAGPISTSDSGDYTAARSADGKSLIITDPAGTHEVVYSASPNAVLRWDGDDLMIVEDEKQTRISKSAGEWQVVVESASTTDGAEVTPN